MNPAPRPNQPKFELFGDTLSGRVLWLTVAIILIIELVVMLPGLGRERQAWLWDRIAHAHLATYPLAQSGATLSPQAQDSLLSFALDDEIILKEPGQPPLTLRTTRPIPPIDRSAVLTDETLWYSTWRAVIHLAGLGGREMQIIAPSPLQPGAVLEVTVNETPLDADLHAHAEHAFTVTVIMALVTGLLIFAVLDRLLVRPMRIITTSIINFREDPEQESASDLSWLANRPEDEISGAARELKSMQDEMRAALWRNARLAAVGTSVAKISHDLRNILSSALLVSDRLESINDPAVQRASRTLVSAVERSAQLVTRTVDFAREGPPPVVRSAVPLHDLVDEAALVVAPVNSGVAIRNEVPAPLVLSLDSGQIYRVLVNLMRNAAEAGCKTITVSTESRGGVTRMRVADDGPGLPLRVQDRLFQPFTSSGRYGGTGLGLAIARDLIRAHGGDLVLEETGPRGTVFAMDLTISETQI
ncbi:sensor histidine kinase [Acidocella aromatica]|uniref:histidine kinase n=1 Tax=Acidocella aromatica TaxID=1303579 RepID=A0A840VJR7_9PROT|nr:HAMP domain-containing sensor histidine kinase [Acidocella aromatica]MBB5372499.1 signal transduction histidine kinase [Acidocella aromatica]